MKFIIFLLSMIIFIGCGGDNKIKIEDTYFYKTKNGDLEVKGFISISLKNSPNIDIEETIQNFTYNVDEKRECILSASPDLNYSLTTTTNTIIPYDVIIDSRCAKMNKLNIKYIITLKRIYNNGSFTEVKTIKKTTSIKLNTLNNPFYKMTNNQESNGYKIEVNILNNLNVDTINIATINIKNSNNELIKNDEISNLTISSLNHLIHFEDNKFSTSFSNKNRIPLKLYTGKKAGIEILNFKVNLINGISFETNKTLVVIGGNPYNISLVPLESSLEDGVFITKYRIIATDRYGNIPQDGSIIYVGIIGGIDKSSNNQELYVNKGGKISFFNNINTNFELTNNNYDFYNVDKNDLLIIFANDEREDQKYIGGWIISDVENSKKLILKGKFFGEATDKLTFVIGKPSRYNPGTSQMEVITFDNPEKAYILNKGTATFSIKYPNYFVGKTVYLYANSYKKERVGTSVKQILWGTGINVSPETYVMSIGDGGIEDATFSFSTDKDTLEDEKFYLSNFDFSAQCANIQMIVNNTGESGQIVIRARDYNNSKGHCTIKWNGSITFEH